MDIMGVYVSPFVPMLALAWLVTASLGAVGSSLALFRWVWHPPLFTLCLFVVALAGIVLAVAA